MRTRTAGVVLAWLLAAGAATVVGAVAVGAIGDGIVPPAEQPLSQDEVNRQLAQPTATTGTPSTSSRPTSTGPPPSSKPAASSRKVFTSSGGTVYARCTPDVEVTASPAQGFRLDEIEAENGGRRVQFESVADDDVQVLVQVNCRGGKPVASTKREGSDDD